MSKVSTVRKGFTTLETDANFLEWVKPTMLDSMIDEAANLHGVEALDPKHTKLLNS